MSTRRLLSCPDCGRTRMTAIKKDGLLHIFCTACTNFKKVPVDGKSEPSKKRKAKARETREKARKRKKEEKKQDDPYRELKDIRLRKELIAVKRICDEGERIRIMARQIAEKDIADILERQLDKDEAEIRRKLGLPPEDPATAEPSASTLEKRSSLPVMPDLQTLIRANKAEIRRNLGLPPEDPATAEPSASTVEEKRSSLPARSASEAEQMTECLPTLKRTNKDDAQLKTAFDTLFACIKNVATKPDEEKFQMIRLFNADFQERVCKLDDGIKLLELCGFRTIDGGEFLFAERQG